MMVRNVYMAGGLFRKTFHVKRFGCGNLVQGNGLRTGAGGNESGNRERAARE
jgi:hypothetical protein